MKIKKLLKKILPEFVINIWHFFNSLFYSIYWNFPSKKIIIIGITGTKGKTSTANFIWSVLNSAGIKTGLISTANIKIGNKSQLNKFHMTMLSPKIVHKFINQMIKENCKVCVIETSSEGLKQFRHIGIYYDTAVFTNLTPEHLPSHKNSFEIYKKMKQRMFKYLTKKTKYFNNKKFLKTIIVNKDDKFYKDFIKFKADQHWTFSIYTKSDFKAKNIQEKIGRTEFELNKTKYCLNLTGKFNIYNALPAIIIAKKLFNLNEKQIQNGLEKLKKIPGRMEMIDLGQDFLVFVDYAHEQNSITNVLNTAKNIKQPDSKIIILLGAEGGGRDKNKRFQMGKICAQKADFIIVSNVDPYDDDPMEIAQDIAKSAMKYNKTLNKNLFIILDRRQGINKALQLANKNDIVLITGKGAEQSMIIKGKIHKWDDRKIVKQELTKILNLKKHKI